MPGKAPAVENWDELVRDVVRLASELRLQARSQVRSARRSWGAVRKSDVVVTQPETRRSCFCNAPGRLRMPTRCAALASFAFLSLACSRSDRSHADAGRGQATTAVAGTSSDAEILDVRSTAVDMRTESIPDDGSAAASGGRTGAGGATPGSGGAPGSGGGGGAGGWTDLLPNGDFEQGSGDTPAVWQ